MNKLENKITYNNVEKYKVHMEDHYIQSAQMIIGMHYLCFI